MGKIIVFILVFALSVAAGYYFADEVRAFNDTVGDIVLDTIVKINPPKDADALYGRVASKMSGLDVYRTDATAYMKQYSEDTEVVTEIIDQTIHSRYDIEDYYFLSVQEVKVIAEDLDYESHSKSVYAYEDGKAYMSVFADGVEQRLYSFMSKTDFMDYISGDSPDFNILSANKKVHSYSKDEREWVLSFSEYGYDDMMALGESFFGTDVFDESELLDINIEMVVNRSLLVTDMSIAFIFEGTEEEIDPGVDFTSCGNDKNAAVPLYSIGDTKIKQPELSIDYEYYYRAENVKHVELEYDKYTEVDDIRLISDYTEFMNDLPYAEAKSASVVIDTIYRIDRTNYPFRDNCEIVYGEGEKGFFFSMDFSGDNGNYELDYVDGYLILTQGGKEEFEAIDEASARAILRSYVTVSFYYSYHVTDVEVIGADKYRLTLDTRAEDIFASITSNDVSKITHTITVDHTGGDISRFTSDISVELNNGEMITESYSVNYN